MPSGFAPILTSFISIMISSGVDLTFAKDARWNVVRISESDH